MPHDSLSLARIMLCYPQVRSPLVHHRLHLLRPRRHLHLPPPPYQPSIHSRLEGLPNP